jgi:hypothetical protein
MAAFDDISRQLFLDGTATMRRLSKARVEAVTDNTATLADARHPDAVAQMQAIVEQFFAAMAAKVERNTADGPL